MLVLTSVPHCLLCPWLLAYAQQVGFTITNNKCSMAELVCLSVLQGLALVPWNMVQGFSGLLGIHR